MLEVFPGLEDVGFDFAWGGYVAITMERTPHLGRLGQAHEIARGVAFLCSDEAGFVTGSTLSINGGQHMY